MASQKRRMERQEKAAVRLPMCFHKYRWFFQKECGSCIIKEECERATLIKRAKEREERLKKIYELIHPNILDHKYDFLEEDSED